MSDINSKINMEYTMAPISRSIETFQKRLLELINPTIEVQSQTLRLFSDNLAKQINEAYAIPLQKLAMQFTESLIPFKDISLNLTEKIRPLSDMLKNIRFDADISLQELSSDSSEKIINISQDVFNDIDESLKSECKASPIAPSDTIKGANKLTVQDVINIIALILTLITLFKDCIPDEQATRIENQLGQLIEIESNILIEYQQSSECTHQ